MSSINRRSALQQLAGAGGALGFGAGFGAFSLAADSRPERAAVTVLPDEPIGVIKPGLYGQFMEHIGGVIYDGVWVGKESSVANTNGCRRQLIDHLKRLGPVVFRWPGGCFADRYHWRDGIGDPTKRPRRFGRWREDIEPNTFGTHEFIDFCRLVGGEPYLAGNVGTGTAEEFQQWVEYCNAPAGKTTLSDERVSHGDQNPFGVRYWGVGNESWGCGGKFTPEDYCTEYRRFTDWLPSFGVPLFLIAAGPNGNDLNWTRRFFKKWLDYDRAPMHGWAAHYYCGTTGHALNFSRDQWYEMLFKGDQMGKLIHDQWSAMGEFDPEHKVKLLIDEWGCWHPAGTEIHPNHLFEQMGCLRDALVAALTLDTFNRNAEKLEMANIAQLINNIHSLFLADGDKFVATPTFYVYEMYRPHQTAEAVRLDVQAPHVGFKTADGDRELFRIAGSASRRDRNVTVTLVHSHASEPMEIDLTLKGLKVDAARHTVLTHQELNAHNTFERPETVQPRSSDMSANDGRLTVTLPPASIHRFDLQVL